MSPVSSEVESVSVGNPMKGISLETSTFYMPQRRRIVLYGDVNVREQLESFH